MYRFGGRLLAWWLGEVMAVPRPPGVTAGVGGLYWCGALITVEEPGRLRPAWRGG